MLVAYGRELVIKFTTLIEFTLHLIIFLWKIDTCQYVTLCLTYLGISMNVEFWKSQSFKEYWLTIILRYHYCLNSIPSMQSIPPLWITWKNKTHKSFIFSKIKIAVLILHEALTSATDSEALYPKRALQCVGSLFAPMENNVKNQPWQPFLWLQKRSLWNISSPVKSGQLPIGNIKQFIDVDV